MRDKVCGWPTAYAPEFIRVSRVQSPNFGLSYSHSPFPCAYPGTAKCISILSPGY